MKVDGRRSVPPAALARHRVPGVDVGGRVRPQSSAAAPGSRQSDFGRRRRRGRHVGAGPVERFLRRVQFWSHERKLGSGIRFWIQLGGRGRGVRFRGRGCRIQFWIQLGGAVWKQLRVQFRRPRRCRRAGLAERRGGRQRAGGRQHAGRRCVRRRIRRGRRVRSLVGLLLESPRPVLHLPVAAELPRMRGEPVHLRMRRGRCGRKAMRGSSRSERRD